MVLEVSAECTSGAEVDEGNEAIELCLAPCTVTPSAVPIRVEEPLKNNRNKEEWLRKLVVRSEYNEFNESKKNHLRSCAGLGSISSEIRSKG